MPLRSAPLAVVRMASPISAMTSGALTQHLRHFLRDLIDPPSRLFSMKLKTQRPPKRADDILGYTRFTKASVQMIAPPREAFSRQEGCLRFSAD